MIDQIIKVLLRELVLNRFAVVICFAIVSIAVLFVAWNMPEKFESAAVIFADESNIIKPLLAGSAQTTRVANRSRVVKEVIKARRLVSQVVENADILKGGESAAEIEEVINRVQKNINVSGVGNNYIRISYQAPTPGQAYRVTSTITDIFLKDSAATKRDESREAYTFIDKQVKSYKSQLQAAELALKEFNSNNVDGTEASVNSRINMLRADIETIKLDIEGLETRRRSLEKQIASESQFSQKTYRSGIYHQQIKRLEAQLDNLKLSLTDTHPDIVSLRHQISDLEELAKDEGNTPQPDDSTGTDLNPLYQELRGKLAEVEVNIKARKSRLASTEKLLTEEYQRRKRIANSRADLAELTRDYNVTKTIYEDMLARKEKARLSMTLDIEGQGVTYKIQQPAVYPLSPMGIRFSHLFVIGPLVGLIVPIVLVFLYIQIDPRIRLPYLLKEELELPVVAEIPHVATPLSKRIFRRDVVLLLMMVAAVAAVYGVAAFLRINGMEWSKLLL